MFWEQFAPGFAATFAGFILALLGQFGARQIKNLLDRKEIVKGIKEEFELIKSEVAKIAVGATLRFSPIKTPFWEGAVGAKVGLIYKMRWFKIVHAAYAKIEETNEWFDTHTHYFLQDKAGAVDGTDCDIILETIVEHLNKQKVSDKDEEGGGTLVYLIDEALKSLDVKKLKGWKAKVHHED